MIVTKRALGGRSPLSFHKGKVLKYTINSDSVVNWVLSNSNVSFTFVQDLVTGVALHSWTHAEYSSPVYNYSRSLWTMGIIRDYQNAGTQNAIYYNTYVLSPKATQFVAPSVVPITASNGDKSFTFRWNNIAYDQKNPNFTCNIAVVATLPDGKDYLDFSVSCTANQGYSSNDLTDFNSAIVNYLGFPSFVLKKDEDEENNEQTVFASPVSVGYTYRNPHKWLRSPRFPKESFTFNHRATRTYAAGQVGAPLASIYKYNYGSPGFMSIPALVYGRRDTKDGTLFYAMDSEGTNPKGFQWYVDDSSLIIKTYHSSDHSIDPYGVGGYTTTNGYSVSNVPEWTMRIRPFKSRSVWVDWEGFNKYREEAVPEQEELGWMPKSFYQRGQEGELSHRATEIPMVLNTFGYTTGNLNTLTGASKLYRDIYAESVNPNVTEHAIIPTHYQNATLNSTPRTNNDPTSINSTYNGWEPWAGSGIGVSYGPDAFKAPDFTSVNANHAADYTTLAKDGNALYNYLLFPFCISSGSAWTRAHSGDDLRYKDVYDEDYLFTQQEYHDWANGTITSSLLPSDFVSCASPQVSIDKYRDIGKVLGSYGASAYHDTAGLYGRGCSAKSHVYTLSGTSNVVRHTHPRGAFTRFFNRKHLSWWDAWHSGSQEGFSDWKRLNPSDNQSITLNDFKLANSSEFPCDLNLGHIPITLIYEALGPIFNTYVNEIRDPRPDAQGNNIAGTNIDTYSDATINTILSGAPSLEYWTCLVEPPNWIQRCPAYQIAFADRVITNEWSAIYASNTYDLFFTSGPITGYGTYGQVLRDTGSKEHSVQDWASFSTTRWPYSNKMSTWHVSSQFGNIVAAYSGLPVESGIFYSGLWSGYTDNVVQKQFRIQAYNPDYIYHGKFRHPLDDFGTEYSLAPTTTRTFRKFKLPNLLDATGIFGEDKVTHFVREHRDNGNLLIVIGNWFSGTSPFSGTFDPTSYGIDEGYQIYSLDVNTSNHGTRTLESIQEPLQTYPINLSLDQFEYKVYEVETNGSVLDNTVFSDLKTNYAPIRYSYDNQYLSTKALSLVYSYGSKTQGEIFPPQEGYRSPFTQQILNNLPQWMKMRQDYNSNGWKLTNSWGMALEEVLEQSTNHTKNLNIATASTLPKSSLSYTDIDSNDLLTPKAPKNLLFNSSFAIRDVARTRMPAGWQKHTILDSIYTSSTDSMITSGCIVSPTGILKVGQEVELNNTLIGKLYASCYIKCNATSVNVKLHISVEKIDGTTTSRQAILTNRSSEWQRLVLPVDINAQIYRVSFTVNSESNAEVRISAPQLEVTSLSSWSKSILDYLFYYPSINNFNLVYKYTEDSLQTRHTIFPISDEDVFLDAAIPTRVEKVTKPLIDLEEYIPSEFGRKVDQLQEIVRLEWTIIDGQIVERSVSPTVWDIYGRYDIRDLRYFETLEFGTRVETNVTILPICCAVRNGYLFVVCKETFEGNVKHVLKIVKPRTPPNGETYLESIKDFDLNLQFDTLYKIYDQITEEVYSVSFSDIDTNYMIITTTNNVKHYFNLYFDYYYLDGLKNRMYLIQNYTNSNIAVL